MSTRRGRRASGCGTRTSTKRAKCTADTRAAHGSVSPTLIEDLQVADLVSDWDADSTFVSGPGSVATSRRDVLVAHAAGDDGLVAALASPLHEAGYTVAHRGTVLPGDSVVEDASRLLQLGAPVILCATVNAMGTGWAHRVVHAARANADCRVFIIQMEADAYVDQLGFGSVIARYWEDPSRAINDLVLALQRYYPTADNVEPLSAGYDAEERYRSIALKTCDIVNLAELPERDRHLAMRELELRRLYVRVTRLA